MQKLLALIISCHRLAVPAEALSPPVYDVVSVWGRVEGGGGSTTTLQTTGHGVGWAAQQEHCTGLPHLTHKAQEEESPGDGSESQATSSLLLYIVCHCAVVPSMLVNLYTITLHQYTSNFFLLWQANHCHSEHAISVCRASPFYTIIYLHICFTMSHI